MKRVTSNSSQKVSFLDRIHAPAWMVGILALVFALRVPSFFEPYYYGDEMIYLNLGEAVRRGLILYRDIHDNKPPLLYFTASIAGNVFWFRAILAAWSLGTVFVFWRLVRNLFPKELTLVKIATLIFAVFTSIPLLEGQIANAENFMIGTTVLAFWILLRFKNNFFNLFLAGVLLSLSALFKIPAAFDILAIIFLWFTAIKFNTKGVRSFIVKSFVLSLGFLTPIIITFVWYSARGAFSEYLVAAFLQNFGYLSSWRNSQVVEPFLVRNGPLLLRGGMLVGVMVLLFVYRKKLTKEFIFSSMWLSTSLFAATLSERPYPHYLLQAMPAIAILFAMLLFKKTVEQSLTIIPLSLVFVIAVFFKFWYYPTLPYYERFIRFSNHSISQDDYFNSFDANTTRNYTLAEFLLTSSRETDSVFVWGDSPTVYALSHRLPPIKYVATYHINDFSSHAEVLSALSNNRPEFIIVLPQSDSFSELYSLIQPSYYLVQEIDGAKIYKLLSEN